MIAAANIDVFVLMNGLLQRFPNHRQPKVYYGLSQYFSESPQFEHAVVIDARLSFAEVVPSPQFVSDETGAIDWIVMDAYLDTNPKKLPEYKFARVNVIDAILKSAASNDKHSLSAMLSNFTPAARPAVTQKVIEFLTDPDPNSKHFTLPESLRPKRGRGVQYYEAAVATDFSALKEDIRREHPQEYEARYWKKKIAKELEKSGTEKG